MRLVHATSVAFFGEKTNATEVACTGNAAQLFPGHNASAEEPDRAPRSQNGQSRGRRFRARRSGVLGADCTVNRSGWPMRNRCGTVSTNVFSTE